MDDKFDKGFFASVPRLVRTGYAQLSITTKWVYVCLKDLCGEDGVCYRTLRTLATEIGNNISISTLSEAIRALCAAGLIKAIKQKRSNKPTAKETWHISIVNIWTQNGQKHPTPKRSLSEQNTECSVSEQSNSSHSENVRSANNNVRTTNTNASFCSDDEPKRSLSETEEEEFKKDHFKEISVEEENDAVFTSSPPNDSSFIHSSVLNSNYSQENSSGLRIAPRSDISPPEMPVLPDSTSQGYKTETRDEPSDNVAVEKNITAEVTPALVMQWLKTLEQEETKNKIKRFSVGRIAGDEEAMGRLLSAVHGLDSLRELYKIVRSLPRFSDGRIVYALNLVKEEVIAEQEARLSEQAKEVQNERMDHEQADLFGQWLVREKAFCFEGVAIDNPYMDPNIWEVCLRYGDGEGDWLRIRNWWHYCHLEEWEQELYALADAYNSLLSQMPAFEPVMLEAVAL